MSPADAALAFHVATARELFEEAGVLLARDATGQHVSLADRADHDRFKTHRAELNAGRRTLREIVEAERLRLALDALVHYAHWVTPPIEIRRFDTQFFVTRVPAAADAGARRSRGDRQRVDQTVRGDCRRRSRRHRAAAADVGVAARARTIRVRRGGTAVGDHAHGVSARAASHDRRRRHASHRIARGPDVARAGAGRVRNAIRAGRRTWSPEPAA